MPSTENGYHVRGPDIREHRAFKVAGCSLPCSTDKVNEIPSVWSKFPSQVANIPNRINGVMYGVCIPQPGPKFLYIASIEVTDTHGLSSEFASCEIPSGTYAVFTHVGSLQHFPDTMSFIFSSWLPNSSYKHGGSPEFELYDDRFDPTIMDGEVEYWLPIKTN